VFTAEVDFQHLIHMRRGGFAAGQPRWCPQDRVRSLNANLGLKSSLLSMERRASSPVKAEIGIEVVSLHHEQAVEQRQNKATT
jgi:hypothetical protein